MNSNETIVAQAANLQRLLESQRAAQLKDPYPTLELRQDRINRMIDMLVRHEQRLVCLLYTSPSPRD